MDEKGSARGEDEQRASKAIKERGGVGLSQMESDGKKVNSFSRQEKIKSTDSTCQLRSLKAHTHTHTDKINISSLYRHHVQTHAHVDSSA